MALSIETSSSATPNIAGSSVTFSHTVTSANLLVTQPVAGNNPTRTFSSVTYNAVGGVNKGRDNNANFEAAEIWVHATPPTGAHNVVATASGTCQITCGCTGFIGADTASFGTFASAKSTTTSAPAVTVVSATGEIVVAVVASDANATITEGGSLLWERQAVDGDSSFGGQSYNGAASVNATWTASSPDVGWVAVGISIKPAAAGTLLIQGKTITNQYIEELEFNSNQVLTVPRAGITPPIAIIGRTIKSQYIEPDWDYPFIQSRRQAGFTPPVTTQNINGRTITNVYFEDLPDFSLYLSRQSKGQTGIIPGSPRRTIYNVAQVTMIEQNNIDEFLKFYGLILTRPSLGTDGPPPPTGLAFIRKGYVGSGFPF